MDSIIITVISSIGTVSIFSFILWLSKNWLIERLSKSIQHEYDKKFQEFTAKLNSKYEQLNLLQTETIHNLSNVSQVAFTKKIEAIQLIWELMVKLNSKSHYCFLLCDILLDKEFEEIPKNQKVLEGLTGLNDAFIMEMIGADNHSAEEARLFSGNYLYAIYFVYRAVFGRIAHLFMVMKNNNKYFSWINDPGLSSILIQIIDKNEWETIKSAKAPRFSLLRQTIENKYLDHASKIISGELSINDGIQQGLNILKTINNMGLTDLYIQKHI